MTNTIYIDMDGVVADFDRAAQEFLQVDQAELDRALENHRWQPEQWEQIKQIPHLYLNLPKTAYADQIIDLARQFRDQLGWNLYMLTAIPKKNDIPDCFQDKILWMQKYYPDISVRFGPYSYDKHLHAQPGDILVDDKPENCRDWREKQGIAFQLDPRNYDPTLLALAVKFIELK